MPFAVQGYMEGEQWFTVAAALVGARTSAKTYASAFELSAARKEETHRLYPREKSYGTLSDAQQRKVNRSSQVQDVMKRMKPAAPTAKPTAPIRPTPTPRTQAATPRKSVAQLREELAAAGVR